MKPLLWGVVAALLVGLAFVLGRSGTAPGAVRQAAVTAGPPPAYVAQDATLRQNNPDGSPQYTLTAARLEQHTGSGDLRAQSLTLRYASGAAQPWLLRAREGLLPGDSTRIQLQGNVQLRGTPPGSTQATTIESQRLDYDTRSQVVQTRDPVRILWGNRRLDARGLTADLPASRLTLQADVHGRFAP